MWRAPLHGAAAVFIPLLLAPACERTDSDVILASTTSVQDSGLLDVLIPAFEQAHPRVHVKVIAVGSGEALALGRRGDAAVLLVHSPAEEEAFMRAGHGQRRVPVMQNDFVMVGPPTDPARVRASDSATDALARIAAAGATFVSRGDSSGTHRKELSLWRSAAQHGTLRRAPLILDAGQGMAETLGIASERRAYTLTDRATFTVLAAALQLEIVFEGDDALRNPYSVITVVGAPPAAEVFADWITAAPATTIIGAYGVDQYGARLFTPVRDSTRL